MYELPPFKDEFNSSNQPRIVFYADVPLTFDFIAPICNFCFSLHTNDNQCFKYEPTQPKNKSLRLSIERF